MCISWVVLEAVRRLYVENKWEYDNVFYHGMVLAL
jgi:hypothetical protein